MSDNFIWDQSAGTLSYRGKVLSTGYSGAGRGKNNPTLQAAVGVGPIPRGLWRMMRLYDSPNTGPATIELAPMAGTNTEDRSLFRVHGDSIKHPGTASHGCIILPRAVRQMLWNRRASASRVIEVVA